GQELGGVGVDHIVDLRHMALLHQELDHIDAALGHAVGELLDGDGFRNGDLADELFFGLVGGVPLQPLDAAAEGGDGSLALVVGVERVRVRRPSAFFLPAATRRFRRRRRSRRAGTAACARGLILVGLERRPRSGPCRRDAVLAEALLRLLLGLDLGFEVVFATLLFVGLACFGGLAVGPLAGPAQTADERFLFRNLALFGFAQPRVVERVHARLLFFLGQAAQHHAARRLGGGSGSGRGGRRGRCGWLAGGGTLGRRHGR